MVSDSDRLDRGIFGPDHGGGRRYKWKSHAMDHLFLSIGGRGGVSVVERTTGRFEPDLGLGVLRDRLYRR